MQKINEFVINIICLAKKILKWEIWETAVLALPLNGVATEGQEGIDTQGAKFIEGAS